jgi:hypothetical protein
VLRTLREREHRQGNVAVVTREETEQENRYARGHEAENAALAKKMVHYLKLPEWKRTRCGGFCRNS